jgi:hypothetical protein
VNSEPHVLLDADLTSVDLSSATDARQAPPCVKSDIDTRSEATSIQTDCMEIEIGGHKLTGAIDFRSERSSESGQSLSPGKQREFKSDFRREAARLKDWADRQNWPESSVGELRVVVSDQYKISKSLVPAWSGCTGHMEFPAWRVMSRKAAIMHELVHVFFPNANRFLAEGLAVYLQAAIGENPAFPNFGTPLHENARERLREMTPLNSRADRPDLTQIHLAELDAIATPSPLTLRVGDDFYGEDRRGQAFVYSIAGSFVQFLVETRRMGKFRAIYERTPLIPLAHNGGSPDRWHDVYRATLADLEREWKLMIVAGVCD